MDATLASTGYRFAFTLPIHERRLMKIETTTSVYTAEYLLEYFEQTGVTEDTQFTLESPNENRYMLINGKRAYAIMFSSCNKMPPVGFTRVEDVKHNGITYRCFIKWADWQDALT